MPFEIEPIGAQKAYQAPHVAPSWNWIGQQPYNRDAAFEAIGNFRPGSLGGGPSGSQIELLSDPNKYRIAAPKPPITSPALTSQSKGYRQFGTSTLNLIDPFMTMQSASQGLGVNEDVSRQAQTFLGERDIDPFGQGAAGVPARLFDYATGWLGALYDHVEGKPILAPMPTDAGTLQYDFQRDPGYWALVGAPNATDAYLAGVAAQVAGRYDSIDKGRLTAQLAAQFKIDRDRALGISSGDRRVDYQAKLEFTQNFIAQAQGGNRYLSDAGTVGLMQLPSAIVGAIPFVGADIREAAYQHPPLIEDEWRKLTPEQRGYYFEQAGARMLVGDVAVWLPLMSGLGAVEAVAARSGGMAYKAFKVYEYTRNVTTAVMATGVAVATANWALEAAVPGYSETFGRRLDYARPWSGSNLAGLVNQMGFFSSGTFGVATAARAAPRVAGKIAEIAHLPTPGVPELAFLRLGRGGSAMTRELAGTGLPDPGLLDLAPKATFLSRMLNWIEGNRRGIYDAYVRGHPTGNPALDEITDPALRIEAANAALLRGLDSSSIEAEGLLKHGLEARRRRPLLGGELQRDHDAAVKLWRYIDDDVARIDVEESGPLWLTRRIKGEYSVANMERYARDTVTRLGGDPARLGKHNEEGWSQAIRQLHDYEYAKNNGLLQVAAEGAEEAPRLLLVQADHLFDNDVDAILARLRGDDPALAAASAENVVRTKREVAEWYAKEWQPPAGVQRMPGNVPPSELAEWIEDIRTALPSRRALPAEGSPTAGLDLNTFQAGLEGDGLWTLAFKPTDEAGNAISYVRRANGRVFKSPWIEYPMGNAEAIELGNRGLLLSKIDGITRGFRTWRLVEFQKALLFRRLTAKLDVGPEQIEQFHAGIMRLARETGSQPQTLGAIARASAPLQQRLVQKEIDQLVKNVFGEGVHLDKLGKPVNFYDEIAKAYRQSFRMNLTAGLTSYLKANLGEVGSMIAWASDHAYVTWRFNMSPIFKGGEIAETAVFNAMRGVRDVDPLTLALYNRVGAGKSFEPLMVEQSYDDMIRSITGQEGDLRGPSALAAASEAFYARHLPEDFTLRARTALEQQQAADMRAVHGGGDLPTAGMFERPTGRVVLSTQIPDNYTTLLGDIRPDLLDPEMLAADQKLWHATTQTSTVMREGLKARKEIYPTPELPRMGETFNDWLDRAKPVAGDPKDVGAKAYLAVSGPEFLAAKEGGLFERTGVGHAGLAGYHGIDLTTDPHSLAGRSGGYIVEFGNERIQPLVGGARRGPNIIRTGSVDFGLRDRVWQWDTEAGDYRLAYEGLYVTAGVPRPIGLGGPGTFVSVTPIKEMVDTAAMRLRFASQAAHDQISAQDIIDHFAPYYGDEWSTFAQAVGYPALVGSEESRQRFIDWFKSQFDQGGGEAKFRAVRDLDAAIEWLHPSGETGFKGKVLLIGSFEDALRINPDEVGVVQVAAERGSAPGVGTDKWAGELTFPSDKLLVIDDLERLGPLAEDEQGLLEQLRATLADQPKEGQLTIVDHMVGGNGIALGMEDRARRILTKLEDLRTGKLDGGPTFAWDQITPARQNEFVTQLVRDGWSPSRTPNAWQRARLDGSVDSGRTVENLYDEYQRREGAAAAFEDVAGTPEALFERLVPDLAEQGARTETGWRQRAWETFKHPVGWKLEKGVLPLQIKLARDEFPSWLRVSGNEGVVQAFRESGVPENRWLDWLIEDRVLTDKWLSAGEHTDFAALLAHAGDDAALRGTFDELYASPEWAGLSALIAAGMKSAGQEAFGVHFFAPYRSALERSINHPLLGLYPASWSLKAAREWARFLYNNRTLGIDIGMAPAQAIAQIVHAQHAAFAQMNDQDLDDWLYRGPLGSPIFIFNLLMPGDWASLPFAASRTIRDYARPALSGAPLPDAGEVFANNLRTIGLTRDARLFFESVGQVGDIAFDWAPALEDPSRRARRYSVKGTEALTYEPPAR